MGATVREHHSFDFKKTCTQYLTSESFHKLFWFASSAKNTKTTVDTMYRSHLFAEFLTIWHYCVPHSLTRWQASQCMVLKWLPIHYHTADSLYHSNKHFPTVTKACSTRKSWRTENSHWQMTKSHQKSRKLKERRCTAIVQQFRFSFFFFSLYM